MKKIIVLLLLCFLHVYSNYAQNVFFTITEKKKSEIRESVAPLDYIEDDGLGADTTISVTDIYLPSKLNVHYPLKNIFITSSFGRRQDPINRNVKRTHYGIDLRAKYEDVYAMLPGKVKDIGESINAGKYLTIQYGDILYSYCHLNKIYVKQGDSVGAGDVVAMSGNTGRRTTGAHLHISTRFNTSKRYFNPQLLIEIIKETLN